MYAPYHIALGAIHLAAVMQDKEEIRSWFAELTVDMDMVMEVCQVRLFVSNH